jgi:hypothetical protein
VLSLTRPELPYITSVFLKSEGFITDQDLSRRIHASLFRVHEDLLTSGLLTEADDTFSITVRELRQLARVAGAASRLQETAQEEVVEERTAKETQVVAEVTRLFIIEKLYSFDLGKIEEHQKEIKRLVMQEFQIDTLPTLTLIKAVRVPEFDDIELTTDQKKAA